MENRKSYLFHKNSTIHAFRALCLTQNMFPNGNSFPHLCRQVGLGSLMTALVGLSAKHGI